MDMGQSMGQSIDWIGLGWVGLGWVGLHLYFYTKCNTNKIVQCIVQFMNIVNSLDYVIMKPNAILVFCVVIVDFKCP